MFRARHVAPLAPAGLVMAGPAWAADPVKLMLKDHRFTPSQVTVPAGERVSIEVENQDDTPAEFESHDLRVEKVIDVKDKQSFHGLMDANDSLVFVARGEVTLGVDLSRLAVDDTKFDEQTKTAYVTLPAPEILSSRFDEMHSYVHSRSTDLLAKRNEELEALARRKAIAEFEGAAHEPSAVDLAKTQAEKQLRAFAKGWGASDVIVTWRSDSLAANAPIKGADGQLDAP